MIISLLAVNTELYLAVGIDLNVQKKNFFSGSADFSTAFYLHVNKKDITNEGEKLTKF